jgi:hypothetical protein
MDINQLISRAAHADGDHDFGTLGPHSDVDTFKQSVLNDPGLRAMQDEATTFNSIGPPIIEGQNLKTTVLALQEGTPGVSFVTHTGKRFTVKYIELEGKTGSQIVDVGGFNNAALVVDTHQHDFFGKLKSGQLAVDKSIHYVYTSEVENDPATKTRTSDPIFSKSGVGVNLTSYLQVGDGPIVYAGNKPFDVTKPTQDFYSKYTYSLSGIKQVGFFKKIMKQRVSVSVTNDTGSMIQESPDAKVSNSIQSLLKTFLSKLWGNTTPSDKFNIASAWVRKRGGDWLQVLACLDLKNRKYDKPLPENVQPFFMTIDYIALSYALLMGVDTIFFPADKKGILIFNQNAAAPDPATRIRMCQSILTTAGDARIREVSEFLTKMAATRKTVLDQRKASTRALSLNAQDRDGLKKQCMSLFKEALHYAHAHFDFPDVTQTINDLASIEQCPKAQAYLMGRGLYDLHKGVANVPLSFARLFEARDEFKSVDTWANGMNSRITRRIQTLLGGKNNKDVYTFLAYISRVPLDDEIRTILIEKFDALKGSIPASLDATSKTHVLDTCIIVSGFLSSPTFGSGTVDFTAVNRDMDDPMNVSNIVQAVQSDADMDIDVSMDMDTSDGGRRRRRTRRKVMRGGWEESKRFAGVSTLFPNTHTLYPLIGAQIALMKGSQPVRVDSGQLIDILPQTGGSKDVLQFLPIFAMLEALSTQIEPGMEHHPDLPLYNHLFLFLKMAILEVEKNPEIGYALREVLFTMVQTATGRPIVESTLGSTTAFSLTCSSMSEYICGEFVDLDEAPGIALLQRADIATVLKTLYTNSAVGAPIDLATVLAEKQAISLKIIGETDSDKQAPGAPMKPARVRSDSLGDPMPFSLAGRRRTRRLTNDFLQSVRHQSIKMSSRRHSLSGKPFKR